MREKLHMDDSHDFITHSSSRRRFLLVVSALLAGCDGGGGPERRFAGTDISSVQWGRGFDLTDPTGRRRTLADFRGKVVLVYFGYTNCPDACPLALSEMAHVVKQLGPDGDKVQGLFITVDPERDTPERLASYVPAFHPSFIGLRGSPREAAEVAKEFKIYYQAQKQDKDAHSAQGTQHDSYMVDHSTGIYVLDKSGRARLYFSASKRSVEAMVHDVKPLIKQ